MKGCNCPNCGERQRYRLEISSKIEESCPQCGKPLLAQRDKTGIAVKAFDTDDPPPTPKAQRPKKAG
jgi:hypothetical protein